MRTKRSVSPVIAVVLLVLITFMAIGIIWAFIKPMVEGSLEEGGTCFELRDHAKIPDSDFTCYNETDSTTRIMIERSFEEEEIRGFLISILEEGEANTYKITSDNPDNIKMLSAGSFVSNIEPPGQGEARTYLFENLKGTEAELATISEDGKACSMGSYDIPECI